MSPNNGFYDLLLRAWAWLSAHPMVMWGALSAFIASMWSDLGDGHKWIESIAAGLIAVFISLGIVDVMHESGIHEKWMPVVGLLVGFIGVDRIKTAVRGAWDSKDRPRLFKRKGNNGD